MAIAKLVYIICKYEFRNYLIIINYEEAYHYETYF